jgi:hypothetical protein
MVLNLISEVEFTYLFVALKNSNWRLPLWETIPNPILGSHKIHLIIILKSSFGFKTGLKTSEKTPLK